jgi:hypothetical protein
VFALTFFSTGVMDGHDRSPVRRNEMNSTTESEKKASAPEAPQPKAKCVVTKRAKAAKKASPANKVAGKPKMDRVNKKAEVIGLMKRAKRATLWNSHCTGSRTELLEVPTISTPTV